MGRYLLDLRRFMQLVRCGTGEETFGRADGGDPVLGSTRLLFFLSSGMPVPFFAQHERDPSGHFQWTCSSVRVCSSSLGSRVSLRADLGQSQPGSSNLFAWDVWRQSTIAESAALEILPAPLSMPLETTPNAPYGREGASLKVAGQIGGLR